MRTCKFWIPFLLLLFCSDPTFASGSSFPDIKSAFLAFQDTIKDYGIRIVSTLKDFFPNLFAVAGTLVDGFSQWIFIPFWTFFSYVSGPVSLLLCASNTGRLQPEVTINITNQMRSQILAYHDVTLKHGTDKTNAPLYIQPEQSVCVDFTGISLFPAGTTGVLEYNIDGTNTVVTISWSIPFFRFWPFEGNKFGFLVYDKKHLNTPDSTLTKYESGRWHTYTSQKRDIKVTGRITSNIKATLDVFVQS